MCRLMQAIWGNIWKPMWLCIFSGRRSEHTYENAQRRQVLQMQTIRICLLWSKFFEATFEKTQWRKIQPMRFYASSHVSNLRRHLKSHSGEKSNKCKHCNALWLCILSSKRFEDTFENTHWRQIAQMQPMRLCVVSFNQFEETFENTHIADLTSLEVRPYYVWFWFLERRQDGMVVPREM